MHFRGFKKSNRIKDYYDTVGEAYYTQWKNSTPGMAIIREYERAFVVGELKAAKRRFDSTSNFKVLDLGCGPGRIADFCMEVSDVNYFGIDVSEVMVSSVRNRHSKRVAFVEVQKCNAAEGLPYKNSFFNSVVSIRVLKYNPEWKEIISDVNRVLVLGGTFVFSLPNKYSLNFLSRGAIRSNKNSRSSIKEVVSVLEERGFCDVRIRNSSKLPDIVYLGLPGFVVENVVLPVERLLRELFGPHFSRLLYVSCKKERS